VDDESKIIAEALEVLPASIRADYHGIAYLKAQTVSDLPRADQVRAIARHVRYRSRVDRRSSSLEVLPRIDESACDPAAAAELKDAIGSLLLEDQAIISLILAGFTHREIGKITRTSAATITRRLKRLRPFQGAD
jgi:hypothetical protein